MSPEYIVVDCIPTNIEGHTSMEKDWYTEAVQAQISTHTSVLDLAFVS